MNLAGLLRLALMHFSRTFIWSATALGLLILLTFFAMISYDSYRSTLQINEQAATNIATLVEQDVARNIELFDLSVQAVVAGVNDPAVIGQTPRLRQKTLFARSATARGLGRSSLWTKAVLSSSISPAKSLDRVILAIASTSSSTVISSRI